jgi:hypothetical protein
MNLADLFPDGPHRFQMGLRPVEPAAFFRPRDASGQVLAERCRWLAQDPERYAWLDPEAAPLLAALARSLSPSLSPHLPPSLSLPDLGGRVEPDVLLLTPDAAGDFRLRGGVLCFPTGWALREKIGGTVADLHGVVPGLNPALGPALRQALARLRPGQAWQRANWGLAATPELNLHPALGRPAPAPPVQLDRLWLRVEEQLLLALPDVRGLVFAIRIELIRLDDLARDPAAAAGLARALRAMPADLAAYKRLASVREPLVGILERTF